MRAVPGLISVIIICSSMIASAETIENYNGTAAVSMFTHLRIMRLSAEGSVRSHTIGEGADGCIRNVLTLDEKYGSVSCTKVECPPIKEKSVVTFSCRISQPD